MSAHIRSIATVVLATATLTTGLVLAQGAGAPPPQTPAPAGQAQTPAPPARGQVQPPAGTRRGGFGQFTRQLAPQEMLIRGKALYEANCARCHATDLRGTGQQAANGTNLLRSGLSLRDEHGELIGAAVAKHTPSITLAQPDTVAIAEYIHSVHAAMGGAGRPPANPALVLPPLVGDVKAGEAEFATRCAACHSVTGNLKGIASKFADARALQGGWISGSSSTFAGGGGGGGRGGDGSAGNPVTVTMANGSKLEGTLVRKNEFLVILTLPDGTRRSIARNDGVPKVDVKDPQQAHKDMALKLAFEDPQSKKMHDITAYLWTIK